MRRTICSVVLGFSVLCGSGRAALAQTFPAKSAWTPVTTDGVSITDPLGDAQNERDIVGDAMHPAAYVYRDASYIYFRLRVTADPQQTASNLAPFGWGVALDTDGNLDNFEYLAMLNGIANPDDVELRKNTVQSSKGSAQDPAEDLIKSYPKSTHGRVETADTSFGGDPDYFVEWAIDLADLKTAGVDLNKPLRLIFGTSNNAQTLASDLLAASADTTISGTASDPVNCGGTSCQACSALCGTSCLRCSGSTPVCDGSKCVGCTDSKQCGGATPVCDVKAGQCMGCTDSKQCAEPTPVCDTGSHRCVDCTSSTHCAEPTPVCDLTQHACVDCTLSSQCSGSTPVCNPSTDKCVASSACAVDTDCKTAALPACQPSKVCGQCSASNQKSCATGTACDIPTGQCLPKGTACTKNTDCADPKLPVCGADKTCGPCASDTDCTAAATPACQPDGSCGECSATNQESCTGATSGCNVPSGTCGETCRTDVDCTAPARPACQASEVCGECTSDNSSLCNGDTPQCDATRGTCTPQDTGLAGAGAGAASGADGQAADAGHANGGTGGGGNATGNAGKPSGEATFEGAGCSIAGGNAAFGAFITASLGLLMSLRRRRRTTPKH